MNSALSHYFKRTLCMLVAVSILFGVSLAHAHKASDAYLAVSEPVGDDVPRSAQGAFQVKYSIALRDIDANLEALDLNNDRQLTWLEVRVATPLIESWVQAGFAVVCGDIRKRLPWTFDGLEQRSDGAYVRLQAMEACTSKPKLAVQYELMKDIDSGHRLLVSGTLGGKSIATVITPQTAALQLTTGIATDSKEGRSFGGQDSQGSATFRRFFTEGFWHLSLGFDHLAFLLALVLPIGLSKSSLFGLLGTVTMFTLGHSVTLGLATFGWIVSSVWVEPAITASIAVTAMLNLHSNAWLHQKLGARSGARWIALLFGLIHGLGFSGVMTEAGVDHSLLLWALAGFNLGLEAAQLIPILLWLLVCFGFLRWLKVRAETWKQVVRGGSVGLLLLALVWTVQRVL
jgi:hypothetical protein